MISKILIVVVLCVSYTLAEAPINRNRYQRFRQAPSRQYSRQFARQEAPYPESQSGEPAAEYGPPKPTYGPPPTTPASAYGAPAAPAGDVEPIENTDSEAVGQPSRFTQFNEKFSLPSKKNPQKFSQKLELQQQVQQFPGQQVVSPFVAAPIQPIVSAPVQYAQAIQQDGSYYIQLPNGSIQRVNYLTQPSVVDNSVLAKLQFRPVGELQTTFAEPQLYVNTVVQSHVSADE